MDDQMINWQRIPYPYGPEPLPRPMGPPVCRDHPECEGCTYPSHGGCASMEEIEALDGYETALLLIDSGAGVVTPYGVVYDSGMKLERLYDGHSFSVYDHDVFQASMVIAPRDDPKGETLLWGIFYFYNS